ncbi:spore germination protein [Alicyclobacillus sp.]|uniref:spore germination protein n=1 Tax=Alicyclobacillus sp. TaxID=61169 RepID=UPI0025C3B482|nr:spore germination protein [Alicyclobacillus sp.]
MAEGTKTTEATRISPHLEDNVRYVNEHIGIGTSWDIIAKPFSFGGIRMMSYVSNGYFMTNNMVLILRDLHQCVRSFVEERADKPFTMQELMDHLTHQVAFVQVQALDRMDKAIHFILSGPLITFLDGFDQALMIDTRVYPMRSISTPDLERTVRGARDAFTETMLMNTALIRRRLREPRLRDELMQIGKNSKTDVCMLYIEGVTDPKLVRHVREKLRAIEVDALFMGQQTLVEHLAGVGWNPYPLVRLTERPDVATTALLEGQIVIVVDTSPNVIILPTSLFHHLQHPQEYQTYPMVGTYMRMVILVALVVHVFLPGVFLLLNAHPDLMPKWLSFMRADQSFPLPLWAQLVLAEFGLDMLQLAVVNSPKELASAIGVLAAMLFGQFAVKIHLVQEEVMVYGGLVAIAQLAMASYELGSANQMARFWTIAWTALFGGWGFVISVLSWLVLLLHTESFGLPYLWPLVPFQWHHGFRQILFRPPMQTVANRNALTNVLFRRGPLRRGAR